MRFTLPGLASATISMTATVYQGAFLDDAIVAFDKSQPQIALPGGVVGWEGTPGVKLFVGGKLQPGCRIPVACVCAIRWVLVHTTVDCAYRRFLETRVWF